MRLLFPSSIVPNALTAVAPQITNMGYLEKRQASVSVTNTLYASTIIGTSTNWVPWSYTSNNASGFFMGYIQTSSYLNTDYWGWCFRLA
jgi:hypothetical protein